MVVSMLSSLFTIPVPSFVLGSRFRQVLPNDLPAYVDENFVDVRCSSCARFVIWYVSPALRQLECFRSRHGSVFLQVGFVANENNGERWIVFRSYYLLSELDQFSKR